MVFETAKEKIDFAKKHHLLQLDLSSYLTTDDNLKEVATLPWLEELQLQSTRITNAGVTQLKTLNNLSFFALKWCWNVTDLSCIESFPKLKGLDLQGNPQLKSDSLNALAKIDQLTRLSLRFCSGLDSSILLFLSHHKNLSELHLGYWCTTQCNLEHLNKGLTILSLESMVLSNEAMSAILELSQLKQLNLFDSIFLDSSTLLRLKELKNLTYLNLNNASKINMTVLETLKKLPHLHYFYYGFLDGNGYVVDPNPFTLTNGATFPFEWFRNLQVLFFGPTNVNYRLQASDEQVKISFVNFYLMRDYFLTQGRVLPELD